MKVSMTRCHSIKESLQGLWIHKYLLSRHLSLRKKILTLKKSVYRQRKYLYRTIGTGRGQLLSPLSDDTTDIETKTSPWIATCHLRFTDLPTVLLYVYLSTCVTNKYFSMTQLLLHTFAHLTGPSFRVKAKLVPNKKILGLV